MRVDVVLPVFLFLSICLTGAISISLTGGKAARPIRKVAVIGSGISGLSVAHALCNSPVLSEKYGLSGSSPASFDVCIFDSIPELNTRAGAGVQLNGGLSVLGKINPDVQQAVLDAGAPITGVRSNCKSWKDGAGFDNLLNLNLREVVQNSNMPGAKDLIKEEDGQLIWTAIMRGALQQVLLDTLPQDIKTGMQFGKDLTDVTTSPDGGLSCVFTDGTTEGPFDLIVGCDGIKSACKEYIETGRISPDASKREGSAAALYTGLRIQYAVKDGDLTEGEEKQQDGPPVLTQFFGDGAYVVEGKFGAGKGKPDTRGMFLVYLDDNYIGPFKKKSETEDEERSLSPQDENADWTQNTESSLDTRQVMLDKMKAAGIFDPVSFTSDIATADRIFELGVYFHNPFSLTGWSKEIRGSGGAHVVLCGDSAHAFPPFLGQGANQAIQDAYCLASKLYEYNQQFMKTEIEEIRMATVLQDYQSQRWPNTFNIFWKSAFLGYLEPGGTSGSYAKFRDLFFKTMGIIGVAERVLLSAATPKV